MNRAQELRRLIERLKVLRSNSRVPHAKDTLAEAIAVATTAQSSLMALMRMRHMNTRDDAHKHALQLMGTFIPEGTKRDAVHIAVAPVISKYDGLLQPADPLCLCAGSSDQVTHARGNAIGVVDPYLPRAVAKDERFLMFLMPMSTTSLRHQWTHPAFPDDESVAEDASAVRASRRWLDDWARQYGYTGDKAIQKAREWIRYGDYWVDGGTFEGETIPNEFWSHYQNATGEIVPEDKQERFLSCSC